MSVCLLLAKSAAEVWRDLAHEEIEVLRRHLVRHRAHAEPGDDAADAEPVESGDVFGDARRRAVDHAVAAAGARTREIALRHLDAQAGIAENPVAHVGA